MSLIDPVPPGHLPLWQSQRWYDSRASFGGTGTTAAIVANQIYASPIIIDRPTLIDAIGINVTAAATAGKIARLMVHALGANGLPGALLLDAGTVLVDAIAVVSITGLALVLPPGIICASVVSDGTPTVEMAAGFRPPWGTTGAASAAVQGSANRGNTNTVAPDPFGAAPAFASAVIVLVALRAL